MGSLVAFLSALFHSPPPVNLPLQRQILGLTVAGIETGVLCPGPIRLKAKNSIRAAATEKMRAQGCAMNRSRKAPVVRVALIHATDGLVIATVKGRQLVLSRGFTIAGDKALPVTALTKNHKGSSMIDDDEPVGQDNELPPGPYGTVKPSSVRRLNKNPIIVMTTVGALVGGITVYGISQRGQHVVASEQISATEERSAATDAAKSLTAGAPEAGVLGGSLAANPPVAPLNPCSGSPIPHDTMQKAMGSAAAVNPSLPTPPQAPASNAEAPCPPPQYAESGENGSPSQPTPYQEYVRHRAESAYAYRMKLIEQHRSFVDAAQSGETEVHFSTAGASPGADNPLATLLAQSGVSPATINSLASTGALSLPGAISPASLAGLSDPNGQNAKRAFASQGNPDSGYLGNAASPPLAPGEVKRGSVVPGIMITGVNSDLPGRLIAQVSEHVYDSTTGKHLLIPQGTKLFGRYDSSVSYGQNRVLVIWTDLIFPNGFSLNLGGMSGSDQAGYAGFRDQRNGHAGRIFGAAILTSLLGTGVRYGSGSSNQTLNGGISVQDAAQQEFSQELGRVANRAIDKGLDLQPTLKIRPGYRFNIIVEKDLVLPDYPLQLIARAR